jgi:mono/diheme cytochrome c family protein
LRKHSIASTPGPARIFKKFRKAGIHSNYFLKPKISVILAIIVASSGAAFGADAGALWAQHCASCHGKDGSGNTTMGKKLGLKDYTKQQGFSDAEATNVIKNGKDKMKAYKDKLSDADIKALVANVRSLKK